MLEKNIKKEERKKRKLWTNFYQRVTATKKTKLERERKKYAQDRAY